MLTRAAGRSVAVPVRFAGDGSPEHSLLPRCSPLEPDGSVQGHLLADVRGVRAAVRGAVVWNPSLEHLVLGDRAGVDRLAESLDPVSGVLGFTGRMAGGVVRGTVEVLTAALTPGFIVIGSLISIIFAYWLYYAVLFAVAGWAFWRILLPGAGVLAVCFVVPEARSQRLRQQPLTAAYATLGVHGPR